MNNLSIFTYEKKTDRMYLCTEGYSTGVRIVIGIAEGDEKVLVIGAGLGMTGELREFVESIVGTDKPIICACTHGHTTSVGGAKLFDKAYLNSRDWEIAKTSGLNTEKRLDNMLDLTARIPSMVDFCKENYIDNTDTVFEDYDDGFVFDLGGITVKVLAIPGHTPGSVALWCPEEGWMFTGDGIAQNVSVKNLDRNGLKQYKNDLEKFIKRVPEDVALYSTYELSKLRIKDVKALIKACEEILVGRTLNDIPGESRFTDNKNRPEMRAHFVENCSVAYDTSKVGAPRSDIENFIFYSYEQVSEHVYVVAENNARLNELTLGLVIGDDKAMLIDTGMGMNGQLRHYIESIVGHKPLIVTSTHGNIDHLGGSIQFDKRHLNIRDHYDVPRACGTPRRFGDMQNFCMGNEEALEYINRHWVDNTQSTFDDIEAGEKFDLGGVVVEVLYSGGHTPGHLSYFIREEKICFTGDSMSTGVLIRRLTRGEMTKYADNMTKFIEYIGRDNTLYSGHSNRGQDTGVFDHIIQACREVVEGKTENDPPANTINSTKPGGLRSAHFNGNCRIIYEDGILNSDNAVTITRDF